MNKIDMVKRVVCVVGLGYVGLPIAKAFTKSMNVIGFDTNIDRLRELRRTDEAGSIFLTDNAEEITKADFIIICVPTPLTRSKEVDLSFVEKASGTVGRNMQKGAFVILESTVYPGVTEDVVKPILEKESGLKCGPDFKIGFSPERINPGDTEHTFETTTKVVAGMDNATTDIIADLYGWITPTVFKARDIKTAEASKLVENIQRDINIALINEFAAIFDKIGINTKDVLDASGTKWNFHRYSPGLVGGNCIPVNPYYLMHKAKQVGYQPRVILAAREMNDSVPGRVARMVTDALRKSGKTVKGSTILVMGLSYKADVADIRESAVKDLVKALIEVGIKVVGLDPTVDPENFRRNWEDEFKLKMLWNIDDVKKETIDGIIFAVAHSSFAKLSLADLQNMQSKTPILIDVPGKYDAAKAKEAGFLYRTL